VNWHALLQHWTHGWPGMALAAVMAEVGIVLGLVHGRGPIHKYLLSPIMAVAIVALVVVVGGITMMVVTNLAPAYATPYAYLLVGLIPVLGYVAGRMAGRIWLDTAHQRGALVLEGGHAQDHSRRLSRALRGQGALRLAGVPVPPEDETKHFKLIGTTGTGKSTAIRELVHGALTRGDRAVIADPDGGYLARFYDPTKGDVILNPFDARSLRWDLFAEIRAVYDVEQLARSLIPDQEGSERTWRGYARTFFTAVTRQAHAAGVRDTAELYRLLTAASTEELRLLVGGTPAQPFLDAGNERMFGSIRSVTGVGVAALEYVQMQRADAFSVRDWVDQGKGVLFLPYQADQIAALRSVIATWMRLAIFQAMSAGEGDRRLWFVVDELDALGAIDGLKDALARLRKFGGRCVLGFQSIAQVSSTYGEGEARTIVENCGNSLILRCSASEGGGTARFASQLIGEREVVRLQESLTRNRTAILAGERSRSTTQAEHRVTESAVMASEIEALPDRAGYLKLASEPVWLKVEFPVYDVTILKKAFVAG